MSAPAQAPFVPPPYPYDRLAKVAAEAGTELVDLSVGTPCDPPAPAVAAALAGSGTEAGYPPSAGTPALRAAVAAYLERRFEVVVDSGQVAACVGTKEFVASSAWYLRLRSPERDTVVGPALAYPTYAMGAALAGCRYVAVPSGPGGAPDLGSLPGEEARRAVALWVNSPSNPSGAVFDLEPAALWGRRHGVPVLSDECYAEFTWSARPASVLAHGAHGVVAVHSLSKRSNFAGGRVGFYAGDPALVGYLSEVRKHAGLMVPGPVQAAAVVALGDDDHVRAQAQRYRRRLAQLVEALEAGGLPASMPAGGFYLWVAVPEWAREQGAAEGRDGAWPLTEHLARRAGVLVSPGEFYGDEGAGFVRIAAVAPDARLAPVLERLRALGDR